MIFFTYYIGILHIHRDSTSRKSLYRIFYHYSEIHDTEMSYSEIIFTIQKQNFTITIQNYDSGFSITIQKILSRITIHNHELDTIS